MFRDEDVSVTSSIFEDKVDDDWGDGEFSLDSFIHVSVKSVHRVDNGICSSVGVDECRKSS